MPASPGQQRQNRGGGRPGTYIEAATNASSAPQRPRSLATTNTTKRPWDTAMNVKKQGPHCRKRNALGWTPPSCSHLPIPPQMAAAARLPRRPQAGNAPNGATRRRAEGGGEDSGPNQVPRITAMEHGPPASKTKRAGHNGTGQRVVTLREPIKDNHPSSCILSVEIALQMLVPGQTFQPRGRESIHPRREAHPDRQG